MYEDPTIVNQYLLFHYATDEVQLPWPSGPKDALNYPLRCISEGFDWSAIKALHADGQPLRGLDLGCAVGRSSLAMAEHVDDVIAIDKSEALIAAAQDAQASGWVDIVAVYEAPNGDTMKSALPHKAHAHKVNFQVGDACDLDNDLGTFDVVLMANLIDRLPDPAACLTRLKDLVKPGGQVFISSPYTWMEEFTPKEKWLSQAGNSLAGLAQHLEPDFERAAVVELPFLIREHQRKFQWSVAQGSRWVRSR